MESIKNKVSNRNKVLITIMVLGIISIMFQDWMHSNDHYVFNSVYFFIVGIVVLVNMNYIKVNFGVGILTVLFELIAFIILLFNVSAVGNYNVESNHHWVLYILPFIPAYLIVGTFKIYRDLKPAKDDLIVIFFKLIFGSLLGIIALGYVIGSLFYISDLIWSSPFIYTF
jgi:hypothetical protein